jgi:ribonucleotide monophosphatase NagD (HAD superfamily)
MATNPDLVCPMPGDEIIDAGAIVAAIEALIQRPLDLIIGKPSQVMIDVLLDQLGLPPQDCLMVGDRMETDMVMGIRAGMGTALVLTGVTTREQAEMSSTGPDLILETLEDLIPAISR